MGFPSVPSRHYLYKLTILVGILVGLFYFLITDVAVSFEVWFSNSLYRIQASAIITRSNIVRYYINDYRNWGRISIRCWIHERCPIPCPNRWAMGCFCEKIDRIIMAPHCSSLGIYYEITVRWMLWNLNNKSFMSTLVQVMAWCLQVTSIQVPEPMLSSVMPLGQNNLIDWSFLLVGYETLPSTSLWANCVD